MLRTPREENTVTALDGRLRRQDGVLVQEAQGQTVLLRLDDGGYYALDEVGALIWELCDGQRSLADVVAALCGEFDAPQATVAADVLEFVGELRHEQLLVDAG
jgi:coenzyme PQQ biosynthesis protein PqqD